LYAIVGRRKDLVQKFIEKKANLFLTTKKPDFTVTSQLIESTRTFDSNAKLQSDGHSFTTLHLAILQGNQELVAMILEAEPRLLDIFDERGNSCYHHIARISNVETQKKILSLLASKSISNNNFMAILNKQNDNGETFLHKIVRTKNSALLHYAVENYGKYFNAKLVNKAQKTAAYYLDIVFQIDNTVKSGKGTSRSDLLKRDNDMMVDLKKIS
jgi:ankyrin repeat protein